MIDVTEIAKSYGAVQALRGISFHIGDGEIVGLLGPNGAGKTTTIKILTGYLQPDAGSVLIDGLDVVEQTREVQKRIGYLPENAPLYPDLSIQRYLRMIADLREIPAAQQREYISDAVYATNLVDHLNRPIGELSKGYRQRVGLAQAILHRPKLLILDEPTIGLDPTQILDIRRLIQRLSRTTTILFSTHILSEVEALCNRAIIIIDGAIRADARLPELAHSAGAVLVLQRTVPEVDALLAPLPGVTAVDPFTATGGYPAWRVHATSDGDLCPAIYEVARQQAWPVRELRRDVRTLEDVFNSLVTTAQ